MSKTLSYECSCGWQSTIRPINELCPDCHKSVNVTVFNEPKGSSTPADESADNAAETFINQVAGVDSITMALYKSLFIAGAQWQKEREGWIDASKKTPDLIEGKDFSENVLAVINGHLGVACYCYIGGDDGGFFWANCYDTLDGDAEVDDEYDVTYWMPKPSLPEPPKSEKK